jgi:hypothetical protein
MRRPSSVRGLENLGRVRLSKNFFLRDFLHSEIGSFYGVQNIPDDPDLTIEVGRRLCEELLEPLEAQFGRIAIRSAYRSCEVNRLGNEKGLNCASNERNYAGHIWDRRDARGLKGATACIVVPRLADHRDRGGDWRDMAWWIHDTLPYSDLMFFPALYAFNVRWYEAPERHISSHAEPRGILTKPGMANHEGSHLPLYQHSALFRS